MHGRPRASYSGSAGKGDPMPIYMASSPDISSISGYSVVAEACPGGNGDPWGATEYDIGDGTSFIGGRTVWDTDLSNGFDTGSDEFQLRMSAGGGLGGAGWSVQGTDDGPLAFD